MITNTYTYDENKNEIHINCTECGGEFIIPCTKEQAHDLRTRSKCIQNIFPDVSADMRELFLSGMCGKCFDEMFGLDEEFNEEDE